MTERTSVAVQVGDAAPARRTDELRALVLASPPLSEGGGVAGVCRSMVAALRGAGYRTDYLSTQARMSHFVWDGVIPARLSSSAEFLTTATLDTPHYDLVVTNGPVGWRVTADRAVHFYHGTYAGQAEAVRRHTSRRGYVKLKYLDSMVFERLAGRGKLCLANSTQTAAEIERLFGYDCQVVWCPVDTGAFRPGARDTALLEELGIDHTRPVCLFVGAGRPMKGSAVVYRAVERLAEVTWVIVGDGTAVPQRVRSATHVIDGVDPRRMPPLLRSVDLLVAPSFYEPFGLLVLEALASGLPVVTSRGGAASLILAGHPGLQRLLVERPDDLDALAEQVSDLLTDPQGARSAALAAREEIERLLSPSAWQERFLAAVGVR